MGTYHHEFYAFNTRLIEIVTGISYDDDIQTATDTMMEIMRADQRVLEDPAPPWPSASWRIRPSISLFARGASGRTTGACAVI